jgi:hypothetical protein
MHVLDREEKMVRRLSTNGCASYFRWRGEVMKNDPVILNTYAAILPFMNYFVQTELEIGGI